ncbi:MAG: chemotaxis response regulator protein-glutamate methylesterase [Pseudomonadota bacterium]
MSEKIKVLVVDDSAVVRQTLTDILNADPKIEVVGSCGDPYAAASKMRQVTPDVITLDMEMPRMDGLTFLKKLMSQHPIPVVMCSSLTEVGCETTLKALEYGAVDIILKPKLGAKQFLEDSRITICDAVKAAAKSCTKAYREHLVQPKITADAMMPKPSGRAMARTTERVVLVGASTGGTEALKVLLEGLPKDVPGTVIVQHMPEHFTAAFAKRLDGRCGIDVKEAVDGDRVLTGRALIAPGNKHTMLRRNGAYYYVEVKDGPLVCRHRPSVDVLFRSGAHYAGANAIGVIMTGMGDDGARGMLEMKQSGAQTLAQDEASCVVFGMPKEAIDRGGVDKVVSLTGLVPNIMRLAKE